MDGYERFVCMGACLNGNMKSSNRYGQQSVCVRARVHAILLLNPAFSHTIQQKNVVHELPAAHTLFSAGTIDHFCPYSAKIIFVHCFCLVLYVYKICIHP